MDNLTPLFKVFTGYNYFVIITNLYCYYNINLGSILSTSLESEVLDKKEVDKLKAKLPYKDDDVEEEEEEEEEE